MRAARTAGDSWEDFLARPADYFALLAELGFITEDPEKTHGDLPDDIVEAVRALELKPSICRRRCAAIKVSAPASPWFSAK